MYFKLLHDRHVSIYVDNLRILGSDFSASRARFTRADDSIVHLSHPCTTAREN